VISTPATPAPAASPASRPRRREPGETVAPTIEVPSALVLSHLMGIEGIWIAYPITFCAMFVLQMAYYGLVWRKRAVARLI